MRQQITAIRARLHADRKAIYDHSIAAQVVRLVDQNRWNVVHGFIPMAEEVDLTICLGHFLAGGLQVICPRALKNGRLEHRRLHSLTHLKKGLFGTYYPADKDIYTGPYDLIIVPGLAFDRDNFRLGYGGGYYDQFLSRHPEAYKVGVGYHFQRVEEVPRAAHDVRLDLIICND